MFKSTRRSKNSLALPNPKHISVPACLSLKLPTQMLNHTHLAMSLYSPYTSVPINLVCTSYMWICCNTKVVTLLAKVTSSLSSFKISCAIRILQYWISFQEDEHKHTHDFHTLPFLHPVQFFCSDLDLVKKKIFFYCHLNSAPFP